jgi:hypothetical protein
VTWFYFIFGEKMRGKFAAASLIALFLLTLAVVRSPAHNSVEEIKVVIHMEVGYTENGTRVLPEPEWSGANNTEVLEGVDNQIQRGVMKTAMMEVLRILDVYNVKAMFLVFPYFAEKYSELLDMALAKGHVVGIHMHENWKLLTSEMSLEELTSYIKSEKSRVEKAIGREVVVFSYGPGVQLDDVGEKEPPPYYGSLTEDEKVKFFQAVANAGFGYIQSIEEYQEYIPTRLKFLVNNKLTMLPHTFEWYSRTSVNYNFIDDTRQMVNNYVQLTSFGRKVKPVNKLVIAALHHFWLS